MTVLQNNPEPANYVIERTRPDSPTAKHGWRVSTLGEDGDSNEVGVYDTYTDAVAAVNEDRGVDPDELKEEAGTVPEPAGDRRTAYDDDWDDHSEGAQTEDESDRDS